VAYKHYLPEASPEIQAQYAAAETAPVFRGGMTVLLVKGAGSWMDRARERAGEGVRIL
jgi:hypothetical protein